MKTKQRINVAVIKLDRAEGPTELCGPAVPVSTFEQADIILSRWSRTAPDKGGDDKVDFTVIWADGESYEGRYDMTRTGESGEERTGQDLARHIKHHLAFLAHKPECGYFKALYDEGMEATAFEAENFAATYLAGSWNDGMKPTDKKSGPFWCCGKERK